MEVILDVNETDYYGTISKRSIKGPGIPVT
jgi:hypothetical protein